MSQAFRQCTLSANWGGVAFFPAATLLGSFLVCVCCAENSAGTPIIDAPATAGITWIPGPTETVTIAGSVFVLAFYYSANSAVVPGSTPTTCNATDYGATFNDNGYQVLEFIGLGASGFVDTSVSQSWNTPSESISAGSIAPSVSDTIVVLAVCPTANSEITAGTGYTLTNMGGVGFNVGGCQYAVNVGPGSYPTDFGISAEQWLCLAVAFSPAGGGPPPWPGGGAGFTPLYPPIHKQPRGSWGMEAKRADSITAEGIKQSVLDRIDNVTTLHFEYVALSDMAAWKAFEEYALTGGQFAYRPIPDYPNIIVTDPMFQYPGTGTMDAGFSVVEIISMDWTPKFKSFGIFSLDMKLKLVADM